MTEASRAREALSEQLTTFTRRFGKMTITKPFLKEHFNVSRPEARDLNDCHGPHEFDVLQEKIDKSKTEEHQVHEIKEWMRQKKASWADVKCSLRNSLEGDAYAGEISKKDASLKGYASALPAIKAWIQKSSSSKGSVLSGGQGDKEVTSPSAKTIMPKEDEIEEDTEEESEDDSDAEEEEIEEINTFKPIQFADMKFAELKQVVTANPEINKLLPKEGSGKNKAYLVKDYKEAIQQYNTLRSGN